MEEVDGMLAEDQKLLRNPQARAPETAWSCWCRWSYNGEASRSKEACLTDRYSIKHAFAQEDGKQDKNDFLLLTRISTGLKN